MASSFIRMTAIGNVGKELKLNTLPSGTPVLNFSIASTNRWNDKQSNEPKEHTDWLDCVAFGKVAELIHQYVKPGGRIYLAGDFETGSYQNQEQQKVKTVRLVVSEFTALDKTDAAHTGDGQGQYQPQQSRQQYQQQSQSQQSRQQYQQQSQPQQSRQQYQPQQSRQQYQPQQPRQSAPQGGYNEGGR